MAPRSRTTFHRERPSAPKVQCGGEPPAQARPGRSREGKHVSAWEGLYRRGHEPVSLRLKYPALLRLVFRPIRNQGPQFPFLLKVLSPETAQSLQHTQRWFWMERIGN